MNNQDTLDPMFGYVAPKPESFWEWKIQKLQEKQASLRDAGDFTASGAVYDEIDKCREQMAAKFPAADRFPVVPRSLSYPATTRRQKRAHLWHEEIQRRIHERAIAFAKGDEVLASIYHRNMHYGMSMTPDEAHVREDGSRWWCVGRNSSHEFYLGFLADGSFARAACGEDCIYEGDPEFSIEDWEDGGSEPDLNHRTEEIDGKAVKYHWGTKWTQRKADPSGHMYLGHC
jgi:hypothetical protein